MKNFGSDHLISNDQINITIVRVEYNNRFLRLLRISIWSVQTFITINTIQKPIAFKENQKINKKKQIWERKNNCLQINKKLKQNCI